MPGTVNRDPGAAGRKVQAKRIWQRRAFAGSAYTTRRVATASGSTPGSPSACRSRQACAYRNRVHGTAQWGFNSPAVCLLLSTLHLQLAPGLRIPNRVHGTARWGLKALQCACYWAPSTCSSRQACA